MMCQCLGGKDYKPHIDCVVQQLRQNCMMANIAESTAPASVYRSQPSFSSIVCDRKHQHSQGTSELPISKKSEKIVSTALNCGTLQPLADDTSRTAGNPEYILKQEQETNLTHTNSYMCEMNLRSLTPREVFQHNSLVGWNEWSIHKRNVYDNGKVNDVLFRFLVNTSKTRTDQQHADTNVDECCPNNLARKYRPEFDVKHSKVRNANVMQVLLKTDLDPVTVETCARICRVGTIVQHSDAKYLEDLHDDIEPLLNGLIQESCEGTITDYAKEYMNLLQRWMKSYSVYLNSRNPTGDLNECLFPLPADIQKNPECLRSWVEDWELFDFSLPLSGAWVVIEEDTVDLGNTYEIYLSTLRSHVDLTPFDTTVDGEVAWQVIPVDTLANDIMTEKQRLTENDRTKRKYFLDSGKMESRRQQIMQYFIDKYKYNIDNVRHFLNWADTLKHGEETFIHLCNLS